MNKKLLLEYMNRSVEKKPKEQPGPTITISREYGCPGTTLADKLVGELNSKSSKKWEKVDKMAVNMTAAELDVPAETVETVIKATNPGLFYYFVSAFSDHYVPNDFKVKKKLAAVITSLAEQGHVVLVGRGSEFLTGHIERSMHIRLIGDRDWRLKRVMEMHETDEKSAARIMEAIDRERIYLRDFYAGDKPGETVYDVVFNAARLDVTAMALSIIELARSRKLID